MHESMQERTHEGKDHMVVGVMTVCIGDEAS